MLIVDTQEVSLENFDAWGGAEKLKQQIIDAGKTEEFEQLIADLYPDGIDETRLNDLMLFDDDWVRKTLRITEED